jgi:hypothetical protein
MDGVSGAIVPIVHREPKTPATEVYFYTKGENVSWHRCSWELKLYSLKENLCIRKIDDEPPLLFLLVRYSPKSPEDRGEEMAKTSQSDSGNPSN